MKGRIAVAMVVVGITASSAVAATGTSSSSGASSECLVTQAADAAVQRKLQQIDASKVNPSDFFSGANSCISPQLLQSFDLSRFIPDLAGLLTGNIDGLLNSVLNAAKNQVCQVLNEQLSKVLQQLNSSGANFSNGLSSQLRSILGTNRSISAPSSSFGTYSFPASTSYGNVFGATTAYPAPAPVAATTVPTVPAATTTTTGSTGSTLGTTLFGN